MKEFVLGLSQAGLVLFLTFWTVLLANEVNCLISLSFSMDYTLTDVLRATLIPVVVVPIVS